MVIPRLRSGALRIELEALELRGATDPELQASLAQVERLQSTVDTLLSVARDAPRGAPTTNVATLLDELEQRWRGALGADGRPLRVTVNAERAQVAATSPVLAEILDVLLANATGGGPSPSPPATRAGPSHSTSVTRATGSQRMSRTPSNVARGPATATVSAWPLLGRSPSQKMAAWT